MVKRVGQGHLTLPQKGAEILGRIDLKELWKIR